MPILSNVTFAYIKIAQPGKKYQSDETEYSVNAIVSKADAKAWAKQFPKQKAKEVDNEDFQEVYKMAPVFKDQDEQYILKFSKPTHFKDGKALPEKFKPRVLIKDIDGKLLDITATKLVSNGSTGAISYDVNENSFGTFAKLKDILVTDLIEYVAADSCEFGEVKETVKSDFSNPQSKEEETDADNINHGEEYVDSEDETSPF